MLCLAPMAIGIASAEMDGTCLHRVCTILERGPLSRSYRVAQAGKCYGYVYDNAKFECKACGEILYESLTIYTEHHLAANGVCPYCQYDSNND